MCRGGNVVRFCSLPTLLFPFLTWVGLLYLIVVDIHEIIFAVVVRIGVILSCRGYVEN